MNINERCCGPLQHVFSELKLRPLLAVVFEIIVNNPWPTFKNPNNLTYIHYPGYPVLFHKIPAVILKTIVCTFKVQKIMRFNKRFLLFKGPYHKVLDLAQQDL